MGEERGTLCGLKEEKQRLHEIRCQEESIMGEALVPECDAHFEEGWKLLC